MSDRHTAHFDFESDAPVTELLHALPRHADEQGLALRRDPLPEPGEEAAWSESAITFEVAPTPSPRQAPEPPPEGLRPQLLELQDLGEGHSRLRLCLHDATKKAADAGDDSAQELVGRLRQFAEHVAREPGLGRYSSRGPGSEA